MRTDLILPIVTASFPTLAVLIGILLNKSETARIDSRISSLESRLEAKIGGLENRLDSRISALESRFHADMMLVIGKLTELEVRVARLEEKQSR